MSNWQVIEQAIADEIGQSFTIEQHGRAHGGDINDAYIVSDRKRSFFVKINRPQRQAMFAAEAAGLHELRQAALLRVPEPITVGATDEFAFIVLEYIELRRPTRAAMYQLGEGLAELHGIVAPQYGWSMDNTLGLNPQHNARHGSWLEFWRENRLAVMLDVLAPDYPELARDGQRLLDALPKLLAEHQPEASLLHGDLWGGNAGMDADGKPVIYDPAVYYGDRETDLALSELFGGFAPDFHEAYWGAWPVTDGYRQIRRPLYQLYHLLNHVHLFGGAFVGESQHVMQQLISAV